MSVRLTVDRKEISIADRIRFTIEARSRDDYQVDMPQFGEKLEEFAITDFSSPQPELAADKAVVQRRTYVLEPFLSGDYRIPAMTLSFRRKGDTNAAPYSVETEDLVIRVHSLSTNDTQKLELRDIAGPVPLPSSYRLWPWAAGGAGAAVIAGIALWLVLRRRRSRIESAKPIPPHERAFQRLEALVAEDLVGKGEIKRFYQGLSDVLRHYIEDRFGLRAPEETTEEFLVELRRSDALVPAHRELLAAFLNSCDLVKFAAHQPLAADIQAAFDHVKRFIIETVPPPAPEAGTPAAAEEAGKGGAEAHAV